MVKRILLIFSIYLLITGCAKHVPVEAPDEPIAKGDGYQIYHIKGEQYVVFAQNPVQKQALENICNKAWVCTQEQTGVIIVVERTHK